MAELKPLGARVIVRPSSKEETTASGIVIPDTVKGEKPEEGEVIYVGPGNTRDDGSIIPLVLKKGDKVLFSKYAANEFKIDGEELLVIKEDDVLAVIE